MDQTKAAFSASATFITNSRFRQSPLLLYMLHATVGALGLSTRRVPPTRGLGATC